MANARFPPSRGEPAVASATEAQHMNDTRLNTGRVSSTEQTLEIRFKVFYLTPSDDGGQTDKHLVSGC